MVLWDQVEFGFSEDETCNFGPRVESGSALFQVDTTALICPNGEVKQNPEVFASSSGSEICVAANSELSFFTEEGSTYSGTVAFESQIDGLCWCCEGILVVCERNGTIHFMDGSKAAPIFSQPIIHGEDVSQSTFKSVSYATSPDTSTGQLLLLTDDKLLVLSNIHLERLKNGHCNGSDLFKQTKLTTVDISTEHTEGSASVHHLGNHGKYIVTTGRGDSLLTLWAPGSDNLHPIRRMRPAVCDPIVKVGVLERGRYLLLLTDQGCLGLLHVNTLTFVHQWRDMMILDFVFVDTEATVERWQNIKLAILTPGERDTSETCLHICNLRTLKPEYSLGVTVFTQLVQGPPQQEGIFFVEGIKEAQNGAKFVSSLRLRGLAEVQPESRFNRMLYKQQFEKAEALAYDFDLDVELVYKVKANGLLDKLSPWNIDKLSAEEAKGLTSALRTCLARITDEELIVECCVKATPPSMEDLYGLLLYAKDRLSKVGDDNKKAATNGHHNGVQNGHGQGDVVMEKEVAQNAVLMNKVMETSHRLTTFHMTFGPESYNPSHWTEFRAADLLEIMYKQLETGQLNAAFTIWRRHLTEFESTLTAVLVQYHLTVIPEDVHSSILQPLLLREFLPFIIAKLPNALVVVTEWIRQKALNLELLEPEGWPSNGLQMAQLIDRCVEDMSATREHTLITPGGSSLKTGSKETGDSISDALTRLQQLAQELEDLRQLKEKYNCPLTLAEYRKQTTESLIYRMLDQVPVIELIPSVISKVVRPYIKEHKLKSDKMLLQYVVDIGERQGFTYSGGSATCWEEKALAVIRCITETEFKMQAVVAIVQRARLPWKSVVENLVEETLKLDHPLVEELIEQKRLMQLRKVLLKYSQPGVVLNMRNTWKMVNYIIRQDRESALEDTLAFIGKSEYSVVNEMYIYKERLDFLMYSNKAQQALKLVHQLPVKKAIIIGQRLLVSTIRELNAVFHFNKELMYQRAIRATHSTIDILQYLLTFDHEDLESDVGEEFAAALTALKKIHSLQVEFGEFITYKDFMDPTKKQLWILLRQKVLRKAQIVLPVMALHFLNRLSDLLGLCVADIGSEIVLLTAKAGEIKSAIHIAKMLHKQMPGEKTATLLCCLTYKLVKLQSEQESIEKCKTVPNLPAVVYELASLAAVHCKEEMLVDCLELCKGCRLADSIASQCEMGDYDNMLKVSESTKDPYENWTFDAYHKEEGLVLDSATSLPLINTYVLSCVPEIGTHERLPYSQNRLAGSVDGTEEEALANVDEFHRHTLALVQHLEENNQLLMALSCATDALFVLGQYLNVGTPESRPKSKEQYIKYTSIASTHLQNRKEKLIMKIFKQPNCDHAMALGLLLSVKKNGTKLLLNTIKSTGKTLHKITANVAVIGIDFTDFVGDLQVKGLLHTVRSKASWAHFLTKLGFTNEAKTLNFAQGPATVLSHIVQHDDMTLGILRRFTSAFDLSENDTLIKYLRYQLLPPVKPGQDRPPLKRMQAQRAVEAICEISAQNQLLTELNSIMKKVDPYDYERLQFIFDWIIQLDFSQVAQQRNELLNILMMYKRKAPPSEHEISYQTEATQDEHSVEASPPLSPLAQTRIPFHALCSQRVWKIISPELFASTVESWVPMAIQLELKVDQLYLITIKNMVTQYIKDMRIAHPEMATGYTKEFYRETSDSVITMMSQIKKMLLRLSNYEAAMACASSILKELPNGTVKILVLRDSAMLARLWLGLCTPEKEEYEKVLTISKRFEESYKRLSSEEALHLHSLGEPQLIAMASQPELLIKELYQHASIQEHTGHTSKLAALPDIHAAAASIAKINNLSLPAMHIMLIDKWLPSARGGEQDMSVTLDPDNLDLTLRSEEDVHEDQVNLKRLVYVMQYGSVTRNVSFLKDFIFHNKGASTMRQIRAVRCLFMIASHEIIEHAVNEPIKTLQERLQSLLYVYELEQLNIGHTLESFLKCNKDGLVRSIWRRQRHQKRAVKLVANLCLDYRILDVPLWNSILKQLQAFGMTEHLNHVLVRLTEFPELWMIPSMVAMWREVLSTPLTEVSAPLTAVQETDCLETLNLLHRCPCVLDLDLEQCIEQYESLELPLAALSVTLLLPCADDREKTISRIIKNCGATQVLQQLDKWQTGSLQIPLQDQIRTSVYQHISRHGTYGALTDEKHHAELALMLVRQDNITDLLLYLLKYNRMTGCQKLLMLHQQHNPDYASAVLTAEDPEERIRVFGRLYGIEDEICSFLP